MLHQAYEDQYVVGTCNELLKWKFAHLNSVDFRLVQNESGGDTLFMMAKIVHHGDNPELGRDSHRLLAGIVLESAN